MTLPVHTIDEQGRLFEFIDGVYTHVHSELRFKKYLDEKIGITSDGDLYLFEKNKIITSPTGSPIITIIRFDKIDKGRAYLFLTKDKNLCSIHHLDREQHVIELEAMNIEYLTNDGFYACYYYRNLRWGWIEYNVGRDYDEGEFNFADYERDNHPLEPVKLGSNTIISPQGIWIRGDNENIQLIEGTEGCDNAHQLEILSDEGYLLKYLTIFLDTKGSLHYNHKDEDPIIFLADNGNLYRDRRNGCRKVSSELAWKELRKIDRKIYGITHSKEIFHVSADKDCNIQIEQVDFPLFITSGKKTKNARSSN